VVLIHDSDPPFTIGETRTDKHGNWSIDGDFFAGMYGADAKSKTVHGTKCRSGKSKRKHY
jgi:hypothetical protein